MQIGSIYPLFMSISSRMQSVYMSLSYRLSKFWPASHYSCCRYTIHSWCLRLSVLLPPLFRLRATLFLGIMLIVQSGFYFFLSRSLFQLNAVRIDFSTVFIDSSWGFANFAEHVLSVPYFLNIYQSPFYFVRFCMLFICFSFLFFSIF